MAFTSSSAVLCTSNLICSPFLYQTIVSGRRPNSSAILFEEKPLASSLSTSNSLGVTTIIASGFVLSISFQRIASTKFGNCHIK